MRAFATGILTMLVLMGIGLFFQSRMPFQKDPRERGAEARTRDGLEMGGVKKEGSAEHSDSPDGWKQAPVMISPARRQMLGVKIEQVIERTLESVVRTVGTVAYDERRIRQINPRVSGWITRLYADYTGRPVKKGDPLFILYSPDLVSTQEEYLLAKKSLNRVLASPAAHIRTGAEAQVASARKRLLLWSLTQEQIAELEERGKPQLETTIYSEVNGVVTKKSALQGMYITPEMNLYEITDLSTVWVNADIYELELSTVRVGQEAEVTLAAYPGERMHGQVIYIDPYLNTATRTVQVRLEFPNSQGRLKPGMYAQVEIKGKDRRTLAVPQDAVLDSGIRKLVFVEKDQGMYEPREVELANKVGRFYPVLGGLAAGETVVTSATFLIDSESKLMAATSMMGALGMGGIPMEQARMGEMEMEGMTGMEGRKMEQPSFPLEQSKEGLILKLDVDPKPPQRGENRLRVIIQDQGTPISDATVTLAYTMAMPGMGIETVEAVHSKDGIYEATVEFGMKGSWEIEVTVSRGKGKPVKTKFTVQAGK